MNDMKTDIGWIEDARKNVSMDDEWFEPEKNLSLYSYRQNEPRTFFYNFLVIEELSAKDAYTSGKKVKVRGFYSQDSLFVNFEDALIYVLAYAVISGRLVSYVNFLDTKVNGFLKNKYPKASWYMLKIGAARTGITGNPVLTTNLMYICDVFKGNQFRRFRETMERFLCSCKERGNILIANRTEHKTFTLIETVRHGRSSYFLDDHTTNPAIAYRTFWEAVHRYWDVRLEPFNKNDPDRIAWRLNQMLNKHLRVQPNQNNTGYVVEEEIDGLVMHMACQFPKDTRTGLYDALLDITLNVKYEDDSSIFDTSLFKINARFSKRDSFEIYPVYVADEEPGWYCLTKYSVSGLRNAIAEAVLEPLRKTRQIYQDVYNELVSILGYRPYHSLP